MQPASSSLSLLMVFSKLFICFFRMWCYYRSWRIAYHDEFIHQDPSPETDRDRRQN